MQSRFELTGPLTQEYRLRLKRPAPSLGEPRGLAKERRILAPPAVFDIGGKTTNRGSENSAAHDFNSPPDTSPPAGWRCFL
jgi:hypothetical protein